MAERPEDLNLPIAVINRLVKESLPDGVNVSKEARTAISKAASVFVLYATSCANNFALKAKRKTLTGQDVLAAMADMDFEKFVEPLQESLEVYRRGQKGKKDALERRKKDKAAELAANKEDLEEEEVEEEEEEEDDDDGGGAGGGEKDEESSNEAEGDEEMEDDDG